MPLTSHDLIFADLNAFASFIGARFALRGKSDAAGIARLEQKINSILSHLGLTGDGIPTANTPLSSIGSTYNFSVTEEIMDLIRRGKKIEAIKSKPSSCTGSKIPARIYSARKMPSNKLSGQECSEKAGSDAAQRSC